MNLLNLVSIISTLLLGLLMIVFTILLPVAIIFSSRSGIKYRQALAEQLDRLRLGKIGGLTDDFGWHDRWHGLLYGTRIGDGSGLRWSRRSIFIGCNFV